jgi:hypothetical protein
MLNAATYKNYNAIAKHLGRKEGICGKQFVTLI